MGEVRAELEGWLEADAAALTALSEQIAELDGKNAELSALADRAARRSQQEQRLAELRENARKGQELLAQAEAALAERAAEQPQRDTLREQAAALDAIRPRYAQLEELRRSQVQGLGERQKLTRNAAHLEKDLTAAKAEQERAAKMLETWKDVGVRLERANQRYQEQSRRYEELLGLKEQSQAYADTCGKLRTAQELYCSAARNADWCAEQYRNLYRAFLDAQAGVLAAGLQEGRPCPVCGAEHHPNPAPLAAQVPTQEKLDQAQLQADEARKRAEAQSTAAGRLDGLRSQQERVLTEQCAKLLGCGIGELTGNLRGELSAVENEVYDLMEVRITLENRVRERERLEKLQPALVRKIDDLTDRLGENARASAALDARLQALAEQMEHAAATLPYPTERELLDALRELNGKRTAMERALTEAQNRHREVESKLSTLRGRIETLEAELAAAEPVDAAHVREELAQVTGSLQALRKAHTDASIRISGNRQVLDGILSAGAEQEGLEQRQKWLEPLAKTANGGLSGKERLMLETFVQTTWFDRILSCANTRLLRMTEGQYELTRHTEASDGRKLTGLELDVIDHYNGSLRSVRTLSGGESFKASLSLALGLSEVIQRQAGGIRFDTMFVDEGFGSLDEESLRTAMDTLTSLSGSNRLVGIISHVGELKERIDRQIIVTKSREGYSSARIKLE